MSTKSEESDAFFQSLRDNGHCFEAVESHYDKYASKYNFINTSGIKINEVAAKALAEQIENKEEAVILDVPCGTGVTGKSLVQNSFQIIDGVDLSQKMLDEAESTKHYRRLMKNCVSENESLSSSDNTYDGVISVQGIGVAHIQVEHALREFSRVLKPGGIAVYTINDGVNIGDVFDLQKKYFVEEKLKFISMTRRYYLSRFGKDEDCYLCVVKKL